MLSRLIHSRRYVDDFAQSHQRNPSVFDEAARKLKDALCGETGKSETAVVEYFSTALWRDVERGFEHECEEGRVDLNLARISNEMRFLFAWCLSGTAECSSCLTILISSYFHLLTYGYLDEVFVSKLIEETPRCLSIESDPGKRPDETQADRACLIKYADLQSSTVLNWWVLHADRPFNIGRYTDCDIIETNRYVSRLHCHIKRQNGLWRFEDMGSQNGSRVVRAEDVIYDSRNGARRSCALRYGDLIVLAGSSHYWFGGLCGDEFLPRR